VADTGGPAAAQARSAAGRPVNDRESPRVTPLRALRRGGTGEALMAGSPDHHISVARFWPSTPARSCRTSLPQRPQAVGWSCCVRGCPVLLLARPARKWRRGPRSVRSLGCAGTRALSNDQDWFRGSVQVSRTSARPRWRYALYRKYVCDSSNDQHSDNGQSRCLAKIVRVRLLAPRLQRPGKPNEDQIYQQSGPHEVVKP
jgi:hypothetical protein